MRGTTDLFAQLSATALGVNGRMPLHPLESESSAGRRVERRKQEGVVLRSKGPVCPQARAVPCSPALRSCGDRQGLGLGTMLRDPAEAAEGRGAQLQALGYPQVSRGTRPGRPSHVLSLWVQSWGLGQWEQEEEGYPRDCTPCWATSGESAF